MQSDKMVRVNRNNPCPICGRCDWCLVSEDGSAAICPRTPDGAIKEIPGCGYLHILRTGGRDKPRRRGFRIRIRSSADQERDFEPLAKRCQDRLTSGKVNILAVSLGVTVESLRRLRVGWDGAAYTFPMSNAEGQIIGIRRRFPSGRKVSVTGSKTGIFIPAGLDSGIPLLVCEGPTDTAAAITLDFDVIGRPNNNSLVEMTANVCKNRDVVVIADNDCKPDGRNPGLGACRETC